MSSDESESDIMMIDATCLRNHEIMNHVYADMRHDYYLSQDWSKEFYILQALRGFIAVGHGKSESMQVLLPQIQTSYCLFDWKHIRENRSVLKQIRSKLRNYRIKVNYDSDNVLQRIHEYHGRKSWLCSKYRQLCSGMFQHGAMVVEGLPNESSSVVFRMCSIGLYNEENVLIAAELGYVMGGTFTSLSGFCERQKNVSVGKVQILALAQLLSSSGFQFLNLGQPPQKECMQYKIDIGGVEVPRSGFLVRWNEAIERNPIELGVFLRYDGSLFDLFRLDESEINLA